MTDEKNSIYERLLRVQEAVHNIVPTGEFRKSEKMQPKPAISIADVEAVIGPQLLAERLFILWRADSLIDVGDGKVWMMRLDGEIIDVDDPETRIPITWSDIGTSPSSASSFARKSWYKANFHIVEDDEEQKGHSTTRQVGVDSQGYKASPNKPASASQKNMVIKLCGELGAPVPPALNSWSSAQASDHIQTLIDSKTSGIAQETKVNLVSLFEQLAEASGREEMELIVMCGNDSGIKYEGDVRVAEPAIQAKAAVWAQEALRRLQTAPHAE